MSNAITYLLSGRLGNQLQLWACARTLSLRYGWDFLYVPVIHADQFELGRTYPGVLGPLLRSSASLLTRRTVHLKDHAWDSTFNLSGQLTEAYRRDGVVYYLDWSGVFIRIDEYREVLIRELLGDHARAIPPVTDEREVGVHIRRDDSGYPLPLSYYVESLRQIRERVGKPLRVHVYSDGNPQTLGAELARLAGDLEWEPHRGTPVEDMLALARYPNLVISMSWFSYWSAFLSHGARVYAPKDFQYYPHWQPVEAAPTRQAS